MMGRLLQQHTLPGAWVLTGFLVLQRACYLSINPQKDETLETEKAQYYLPDGSTIEVGAVLLLSPQSCQSPGPRRDSHEGLRKCSAAAHEALGDVPGEDVLGIGIVHTVFNSSQAQCKVSPTPRSLTDMKKCL